MENSKLITLLRMLSEKQLKKLLDFVYSPYFNKKQEIALFCSELVYFAPNFEHNKLTKEYIYTRVSGKKTFDEKEMGYWMSDLVKLTEQFIVIEQSKNEDSLYHNTLLKYYVGQKSEKFFLATLRNAHKFQEQYSYRDYSFYLNQYQIHECENEFFDRQKKHTGDDSLQKAIDNFDIYYLSLKLKYSCEILNRRNVVMSEYHLRLLDEILIYLEHHPHDDIPPIAIYSEVLKCLRQPDVEEHFYKLREMLDRYSHFFSHEEARDLYTYALNYCVNKVNRGRIEYTARLFELYKTLIEKGVIYENNILSPWTYMNIVTIGVRLEQFEWIEHFINHYKSQLNPAFRENAYSYNLAYLYFHRHEYARTLRLLFDDVFYFVESKVLLVRSYYELREHDALDSLLASFKMYLKRNKLVSDAKRERYLNFIKFVALLTKIWTGDKNVAKIIDDLKEKIKTTANTVNTKWLIEKADEKLKRQ